MAKHSMQDLKGLCEKTGAGLADTKKALEEAEGGREEVLQIIRVKGLKPLSKREGRSAGMGLIAVKITGTAAGQCGTSAEANAETDFAVKIEKFINMAEVVLQVATESGASTIEELMRAKTADDTVKDTIDVVAVVTGGKLDVANVRQVGSGTVDVYLHRPSQDLPSIVRVLVATGKAGAGVAHDVAMHIVAYSPEYLGRDEVPVEAVEKERETLTEATIAEGKPEAAATKIVEGEVNGFPKENVLFDQPYAKDPKTAVGEIVEASKGKVTGLARL